MVIGVIVILVFVILIVGGIVMVLKTLKATDPRNSELYSDDIISQMSNKEINDKLQSKATAQTFLPFDKIENDVIDLGLHKYRAIIEVSSINYGLRTGTEKEAIELTFQRFLNSLSFPITIFIQTKTIDDTKLLKEMESDFNSIIEKHPLLENYASNYLYQMSRLGDRIGNNKQKKKFIIIPFDEAVTLKDMTEIDKKKYAMKELATRVHSIIDGLTGVGLKSSRMNDMELCELIYSTTHKENYNDFESVYNGEYTDLIVSSGDSLTKDMPPRVVLDWILYEAELRIQNELTLTDEQERDLIGDIEEIRRIYADTDVLPNFKKKEKVISVPISNDMFKKTKNETTATIQTEKNEGYSQVNLEKETYFEESDVNLGEKTTDNTHEEDEFL